nr:hypothetical protein Itr_chr06CG12410 [Ipomoea trifida]
MTQLHLGTCDDCVLCGGHDGGLQFERFIAVKRRQWRLVSSAALPRWSGLAESDDFRGD